MTANAFRMVLGVDPHHDSTQLLRAAERFASRLNAQVDVVEVLELPIPDPLATGWAGGPAAGLPPVMPPEDPASEDLALDELRRAVAATGVFDDIPWEAHVSYGAAATALATFAQEKDADLMVIGAPSSGWSEWLHHLLSGSVAHDLERSCPVPLLLLPTGMRDERSSHPRHATTA